MDYVDDLRCFACGPKNEEGLRLDWKLEGEVMSTYYVSESKYQGWRGVLHGGILAVLLDEAMARLVCVAVGPAVTGEITVRYLKPAPVGETLYVGGRIVKRSRRLVETTGEIRMTGPEGPVIASSRGKIVRIL